MSSYTYNSLPVLENNTLEHSCGLYIRSRAKHNDNCLKKEDSYSNKSLEIEKIS